MCGEREIYGCPELWLGQLDVQLPDGERVWEHVVRLHRVALLALVDEQDRVMLVWRYRFAADRWGWELPGGLVDEDEDPAGAAVREASAGAGGTRFVGWAIVTAAVERGSEVATLNRGISGVRPPEHVPRQRETWSKAEVRKFLAKASSDRLHVAWRLSLYGLRRSEVLGLRWSDIDLKAKTLTVDQARVLVDYKVRIEEPKSRNGKRTLPLDDVLVTALTALRKLQLEESAAAGTAYQTGLTAPDWYSGGEYVITDELGVPVHPEWYSDEFGRLLRRAGLRRITLHESRHTTLTLMEHAGVPISIVSKWAGHYDSAFTQKTYVHASNEDLQRGRSALAKIHKIA